MLNLLHIVCVCVCVCVHARMHTHVHWDHMHGVVAVILGCRQRDWGHRLCQDLTDRFSMGLARLGGTPTDSLSCCPWEQVSPVWSYGVRDTFPTTSSHAGECLWID